MMGNEGPPAERSVRESEIFREPPGSGNYTSSIGAAVGIELCQGRGRTQRERPGKTIVEPEREVPVLAEIEILVVCGGPAGTAAAIAAARLGADVLLVERYNHLGGAFDRHACRRAVEVAMATLAANSRSVLFRQHNGDDTLGDRRISRVGRVSGERLIEIIDLEKDRLPIDLKRPEVVFFVWVMAWQKSS
jgi:hypothetical protein